MLVHFFVCLVSVDVNLQEFLVQKKLLPSEIKMHGIEFSPSPL